MKSSSKFPVLFFLALAIGFTSCDKDTDDLIPDATPATQSAPPTPTISGADGALWAVRTVTSQNVAGMNIDVNFGLAVAAFSDGGDFNSLVNVGSVKVDSHSLTKHDNNSYTQIPSATDPAGIEFDNSVSWEIEGGSGFQGTTTTMNITFPEVSAITSASTVSKSAGYTVSVDNTTGADSVLFLVGGVVKYVAGNATSCTFSASELSGVSTGTSVVQAAAFTSTPTTIGGKTIYHGREAVRSKTVEITE